RYECGARLVPAVSGVNVYDRDIVRNRNTDVRIGVRPAEPLDYLRRIACRVVDTTRGHGMLAERCAVRPSAQTRAVSNSVTREYRESLRDECECVREVVVRFTIFGLDAML